jgi:hypothetical protein
MSRALTNYEPVSRCPIEDVGKFDMLSVIGTFKKVEHVELRGVLLHASRNVVIFVEYQIGILGLVAILCDCARVDGTFGRCKDASSMLHIPRTEAVVKQDGFESSLVADFLVVWRNKH